MEHTQTQCDTLKLSVSYATTGNIHMHLQSRNPGPHLVLYTRTQHSSIHTYTTQRSQLLVQWFQIPVCLQLWNLNCTPSVSLFQVHAHVR